VGANTGQTALTLSSRFPETRIYCFEPIPSTFEQLARNTAAKTRIESICCALGAEPGSGKMTTEPLSVSNTLLVETHTDAKRQTLTEVKVDTVDSFCAARGLQRVDLLKTDTEGYEMKVLHGSKQLLQERRIEFVLAECDFFRRTNEPHGDFTEICQYLSAFGYRVVAFYSGGVDNLGWVWGDVLFRECSGKAPGRVACSPFDRLS
jgi:FkbM family methyltransferase